MVCICNPLKESAAPASAAISAEGNLDSSTIIESTFDPEAPLRIERISENGISTLPKITFNKMQIIRHRDRTKYDRAFSFTIPIFQKNTNYPGLFDLQ